MKRLKRVWVLKEDLERDEVRSRDTVWLKAPSENSDGVLTRDWEIKNLEVFTQMALSEYGELVLGAILKFQENRYSDKVLDDYVENIPIKWRDAIVRDFRCLAHNIKKSILKCDHPEDQIHRPYDYREECKKCGCHRSIDRHADTYEDMWAASRWSDWTI